MKKFLIAAVLLCSAAMSAQTVLPNFQDWCQVGAQPVLLSGLSTGNGPTPTYWQQSFANCTVTVYTHGTTTPLPPLWMDSGGTQTLSNPFNSNALISTQPAYFQFYASAGRYDVCWTGVSTGG